MDLGIWATWFDLADGDRDGVLKWMHAEYLPWLKTLPGHAWVAHYENVGGGASMATIGAKMSRAPADVPTGSQHVVMVGAPSTQTFFAHQRKLPDGYAVRLARRKGVREAFFIEEGRVTGPAAQLRTPGTTPGPAIQFGSFRVASVEDEIDLGRWYWQYRLPHMAQMPGCIGARRLISVASWAKFSVLYEFASLDARMQNFEEPHEALALDPKEWTSRIARYTIHTQGSPVVGARRWPAVG